MKKMDSWDTPLGTLNKQLKKQEQLQTPYIVLSKSGQSDSYVSQHCLTRTGEVKTSFLRARESIRIGSSFFSILNFYIASLYSRISA